MQSKFPIVARGPVFLFLALAGCRPQQTVSPNSTGERVVSLAPSLTEIVCAIGAADLLVGRTTACDYPPDIVAKIPPIGGFGNPSLELLLAAKPSIVLDVDLADETMGQKIETLGVRRVRVRCARLDDIPKAIRRVGTCVHREAAAQSLAENLSRRIQELRQGSISITNRPRVFIEIWADPLMTAGKNSFLSELVAVAGGDNLGDEVPTDYYQVSPEWVVARNPDVILCFYMSRNGSARQQVSTRSGWETVRAVRSKRVYDGFDNNLILRPGPRVLEGIEAIRRCLMETSPGQ